MTIRRYYQDATTTHFSAAVREAITHDGHPALILDETYFYPTSGGQPHDTGRLRDDTAEAVVVDVITTAPDAPVLHILDRPWIGGRIVTGDVDWARRFDHMQQHTGQHILSQAFIRTAEAETVGFHLSDQTVTIDLDTAELDDEQLRRAEQLANEVVWANLPVGARLVSLDEAQRSALRKLPPKHDGLIRLIAIGDFDLTACGGTHVSATGQVGLIKLVRTERRGDQTRVEFRCGARSLADFGRKQAVVAGLVATLTTGPDDLAAAVARLQDEARQWRTEAVALRKELNVHEANALWQSNALVDGQHVVVAVRAGQDADGLRGLANRLVEHERTVALLAVAGERSHFVFARSAEARGHMGDLLRATLSGLPGAKGGGSATLAQGGGPAADETSLLAALDGAVALLRQMTKPIE